MPQRRLVAVVITVQLVAAVTALGTVDPDPTGTAQSAATAAGTQPGAAQAGQVLAPAPPRVDRRTATGGADGAAAHVASPTGVVAPPTSALAPPSPTRSLIVEGEPGPVSDQRRRQLDSQPPELRPSSMGTRFQVEGTLPSGTAWRVTYTRHGSSPTLCMEAALATDTGRGSSAGCDYDAGFDWSGSAVGSEPSNMWFGVVDRSAARVEVRTRDGATGTMHLVDAESIGLRAFVGFVDCREDVGELVAYDVGGGVLASQAIGGSGLMRCDESGDRRFGED